MDKNKEKILIYFENSVGFVNKLSKLADQEWQSLTENGKWTVAGIIVHFISLDAFVLHHRVPYFKKGGVFPKEPDKDKIKHQSLIESKIRKKEDVIEQFILGRRSLIVAINNLEDELWKKNYKINSASYTISKYFSEYIDYDIKLFHKIKKAINLK
ncbi:hypothetical protein NST62_12690 [Ureibacillus sp. FSL K6-8385]|uniref:hypothetical protein n=1 Tax=Ureibacillus sp. FSL K6-8385 TaxID=2954684 RepID=UPI003158D188